MKKLTTGNIKFTTYFIDDKNKIIKKIDKYEKNHNIPNYEYIETKKFKQMIPQRLYITIYHIYKNKERTN